MTAAIHALQPPAGPLAEGQRNEQLQHIAREFEAVLTAAMLKEGLKGATDTGTDREDGGGSTYMDMTCEQLAYFIGRQGVLGIADQIVDSLGGRADERQHASR
jgi:Rod binding domain-containing protein